MQPWQLAAAGSRQPRFRQRQEDNRRAVYAVCRPWRKPCSHALMAGTPARRLADSPHSHTPSAQLRPPSPCNYQHRDRVGTNVIASRVASHTLFRRKQRGLKRARCVSVCLSRNTRVVACAPMLLRRLFSSRRPFVSRERYGEQSVECGLARLQGSSGHA